MTSFFNLKNKRIVSCVLVLCFVLFLLGSCYVILMEASHCCCGFGCKICFEIQMCTRFFTALSLLCVLYFSVKLFLRKRSFNYQIGLSLYRFSLVSDRMKITS